MTLLELQDVRVEAWRGDAWRPLVEDVALQVDEAEICGVVGETGAGKTLSTHAILGLLPPGLRGSGSVGRGVGAFGAGSREARERLGRDTAIVLQNPMISLNPLARVSTQLTEGVVHLKLMSKDEAAQRARSLLVRLGFPDPERVLRLYPHQLSGGMAQRVGIAAALMPRPRLLVVDEPTSALDATVRVEVLEVMRTLAQEERAAVLLVSHDLALVGRFCEQVAVMYGGRIVEHGPTAEILRAPGHPYTEALLGSSITPEAQPRTPLSVIGGTPPSPDQWPAGCVFLERCPHAFARCAAERPRLEGDGTRAAACHLTSGGVRIAETESRAPA